MTSARDRLTIVEYPSASNDYTAKILLDDTTFLPNGVNPTGAGWYSFTMNWESSNSINAPNQSANIFSNPIVLVGIIAAVIAAIGAGIYFAFIAGSGASAGSAGAGAAGGGSVASSAGASSASEADAIDNEDAGEKAIGDAFEKAFDAKPVQPQQQTPQNKGSSSSSQNESSSTDQSVDASSEGAGSQNSNENYSDSGTEQSGGEPSSDSGEA